VVALRQRRLRSAPMDLALCFNTRMARPLKPTLGPFAWAVAAPLTCVALLAVCLVVAPESAPRLPRRAPWAHKKKVRSRGPFRRAP